MKYVFFGTADFSAIVLEKLILAGMPPAFIICNPDRPVGRKKIFTPPPVKIIASRNRIEVRQPETLDGEVLGSGWDFFVVASYARILPPEVLSIPKLGVIGVHPSLLPKYRGSSPIQTAILAGDEEFGVTLYLLDEKIDHGSILASSIIKNQKSAIRYADLLKKLAEVGGNLLIETIPSFMKGEVKPMPQDESQATYTRKFRVEDGYVDLEKDAPAEIERKVRALNPEPGVWTIQNGRRMKILEADVAGDKLQLKKIQFEGKKPVVLA